MKKYKFLLFDADYTLLDFDADMNAAFEANYKHMGLDKQLPYSHDILLKYKEFNNKWWDKFEKNECTQPELFVGRFVDFINHYGFDCDPVSLDESYFGFLGKYGHCLNGALEMIKNLSENYDIYIVTNAKASLQKLRLENSGLLPYIKDYFISETIGFAKPSEKYFNYVFEQISLTDKAEAIIIGDKLSSDILGAVNAGIDSIWYNPSHLPNSENIPSTYEVDSFEKIMEILG